jgi:hypothetical protein
MIDKSAARAEALRDHYNAAFDALLNAQVELAAARAQAMELEARVKQLEQERQDGVARPQA